MFEKLKKANKIPILPICDEAFLPYGNVVSGYDFKELCSVAEKETKIPGEGVIYVPGLSSFESLQVANDLKQNIYGEMEIQIGYCNGQNSLLDALEYHKGNEVIVAVSPIVLLLATMTDMKNFSAVDSGKVKAFYMEAGEAAEIYGTTLHYAPCKADKGGFRSVVVLPKGTNLPLDHSKSDAKGEDKLLMMKNKWLIAHPDSGAARQGACIGVTGENIEITAI